MFVWAPLKVVLFFSFVHLKDAMQVFLKSSLDDTLKYSCYCKIKMSKVTFYFNKTPNILTINLLLLGLVYT